MNSFNVIADPWIPVLKDDMTSLYSVRDVLKYAPDIKCIVSPGSLPSEECAIYRFLFALLTDAYQIENDDDILDIWESGAFDLEVFDEYVEGSGNVFDIFNEERPFMQCPVKTALEYGATPAAAAVLNWAQLSGNTETFFRLGGYPLAKTYEASQYLRVEEYVALLINITFMQSALTSGYATAVCDNQPPLWFMFNGRNLFDTLCLNLYPTEGDDTPMWRRQNFFWHPEEEPDGWLSLAFMPTRIVAPYPAGFRDNKIYQILFNGAFYQDQKIKKVYPEPKEAYDWWKGVEPYIITKRNTGKLKKDMREVEAWRGPTGIAWMHMAEFYGVKLDTATTTHPKVMQIYDKISDCEKAILERLPYKPTQSFYHFELPTQQTKAAQTIFRDFTTTEPWMYDKKKIELVNRFTSYTRAAMIELGKTLKQILHLPNATAENNTVKEMTNGWADRCAQYMYQEFIPKLQNVKSDDDGDMFIGNACDDIIRITKDVLRNIAAKDVFTKINQTNRLIAILNIKKNNMTKANQRERSKKNEKQ